MPLSAAEVQDLLRDLPAWSLEDGKLFRCYRFADFVAAFGFMTQAALLAERADHHPEWFNVYNRVDVWLITHDADGITQKDAALARAMDKLASYQATP